MVCCLGRVWSGRHFFPIKIGFGDPKPLKVQRAAVMVARCRVKSSVLLVRVDDPVPPARCISRSGLAAGDKTRLLVVRPVFRAPNYL